MPLFSLRACRPMDGPHTLFSEERGKGVLVEVNNMAPSIGKVDSREGGISVLTFRYTADTGYLSHWLKLQS